MGFFRAGFLSTFCIALAACAAAPTSEEMASADYGTYPDNYQDVIHDYMENVLKDPDSARYDYLNSPQSGWRRTSNGLKFGYVVCVNINARNSYGGYTGAQPSYFMLRDGTVVSTVHGDGQYMDSLVAGLCKDFIGRYRSPMAKNYSPAELELYKKYKNMPVQ
ncbi:hypothetical protein [Paraburkholderia fungorum]|uniref:Uncharacterized protein n=1 Tax=Paraburkholderia fungorum TaxID=134537 RepID=A0A420FUT0_9BURK|nr:hypothetical protein [Paraburkholderia fungorum]RKF36715.1 hypothetical protein BCY88_35355 [Paraburkholderia fungorum]